MTVQTSAHDTLAPTQEIASPGSHATERLQWLYEQMSETQREQILQIMEAFAATSR